VPLRALLFDAVGTLIELAEPVGETYARAAARHGARISAWRLGDAFARVLGGSSPPAFPGPPAQTLARERAWWRELVRATFLAADSAVRPTDFEACFEELWRHYGSGAGWRARAGAHEALRALRADGIATAVVSNFDRRLHQVLADLQLAPWLDVVVLPSDVGAAKPDPAPLLAALARLDCAPEQAALVGDDPERDFAVARRLGLRAIDVRGLATLAALPAQVALLTRARDGSQEPPR